MCGFGEAGSATLKQRQTLLAAHGKRVRERIDELNQALVLIEDKIEFYEEWSVAGHRPDRKMGTRGKRE